MKRIIALLMTLSLMMGASALAEDAGVIVQSSCSIGQSGENYLAYCFAQVHNNTDNVLCLDEGTFELLSGNETLAAEDVSKLWPQFVAPGEDGYLFDVVPFSEMPPVTGLEYHIQYLQINPAYAGVKMDVSSRVELDESSGMLSIVCEMSNPMDAEAFDPVIAIGLYTDAGQMVYADGRSLKGVGMAAQGKLLVRFEVEETLTQQWISYGALPTQVRAYAMFRTGSD